MKRFGLFLGTVVMLSGLAFAEGKGPAKSPKMAQMTAEQRNKMADVHDKMAACLRSDRPLTDCRDEAMKSCQDAMGGECPMMMGHGKHEMKHYEVK